MAWHEGDDITKRTHIEEEVNNFLAERNQNYSDIEKNDIVTRTMDLFSQKNIGTLEEANNKLSECIQEVIEGFNTTGTPPAQPSSPRETMPYGQAPHDNPVSRRLQEINERVAERISNPDKARTVSQAIEIFYDRIDDSRKTGHWAYSDTKLIIDLSAVIESTIKQEDRRLAGISDNDRLPPYGSNPQNVLTSALDSIAEEKVWKLAGLGRGKALRIGDRALEVLLNLTPEKIQEVRSKAKKREANNQSRRNENSREKRNKYGRMSKSKAAITLGLSLALASTTFLAGRMTKTNYEKSEETKSSSDSLAEHIDNLTHPSGQISSNPENEKTDYSKIRNEIKKITEERDKNKSDLEAALIKLNKHQDNEDALQGSNQNIIKQLVQAEKDTKNYKTQAENAQSDLASEQRKSARMKEEYEIQSKEQSKKHEAKLREQAGDYERQMTEMEDKNIRSDEKRRKEAEKDRNEMVAVEEKYKQQLKEQQEKAKEITDGLRAQIDELNNRLKKAGNLEEAAASGQHYTSQAQQDLVRYSQETQEIYAQILKSMEETRTETIDYQQQLENDIAETEKIIQEMSKKKEESKK